MGIRVTVRSNKIAATSASITKNATQAVSDTVEAGGRLASALSPVRTGSLSSSWYASGPNGVSNYPQSAEEAFGLNPLAYILDELTPEVAEPDLPQPCAILASAVEHDIFVEEGTRYMSPRPILYPTAEAMRNQFLDLLKQVVG